MLPHPTLPPPIFFLDPLQGSYSFKFLIFHAFLHNLLKFSKNMDSAVTKQFYWHKLWCPTNVCHLHSQITLSICTLSLPCYLRKLIHQKFCRTFKDQQSNSRTFQAWKMKFLNSMTFQVLHDLGKPLNQDGWFSALSLPNICFFYIDSVIQKWELSANIWFKILPVIFLATSSDFLLGRCKEICQISVLTYSFFNLTGPTENSLKLNRQTGKSLEKIKINKNTSHG